MVDTDRNNVRFVATVDSIIVRFHARYCSFHPTEKEYIEICLCLSILWHFWYGKVNYDTSSDNINCESSLFNLISSETYHFLTKSTPCNLRKRTSRRCRISIMRILGCIQFNMAAISGPGYSTSVVLFLDSWSSSWFHVSGFVCTSPPSYKQNIMHPVVRTVVDELQYVWRCRKCTK